MASALTYLSNAVSIETVSCLLYVLVLVYTASQFVALARWGVGMPVALKRAVVASTAGHIGKEAKAHKRH